MLAAMKLRVKVSVGRALLFAIPQLPVAGGLKSNDLFAIAVGSCVISTIIAASRDSLAYMTSDGIRLLALKRYLLFLIWIVIIPLLIRVLVDLLLMSPFNRPDDDVPVVDYFCTLSLGWIFHKFWINLLGYSWVKNQRWDEKLNQAREYWLTGLRPMLLQDVLMPIATKLLTALGIPYVLAKGVFPRFGYSVAVNTAVYRFAWLGSLAFCLLCYLAKVFCVKFHDSIRDDRYVIGQRLEDVTELFLRTLLQ